MSFNHPPKPPQPSPLCATRFAIREGEEGELINSVPVFHLAVLLRSFSPAKTTTQAHYVTITLLSNSINQNVSTIKFTEEIIISSLHTVILLLQFFCKFLNSFDTRRPRSSEPYCT